LKDTRGWKLGKAREGLINDQNWEEYFTKILYRPFDIREIYYTAKMVDWGRPDVMRHMMSDNISICYMRQVSLSEDYTHFLVSPHIVDNRTFFSSEGIIQQAPLYLYPDTDKKDMFSHLESPKSEPNLNMKLIKLIALIYGENIEPEAILYYVYGILYSNIYRKKYVEFLKSNFPMVPFTKDRDLFNKIGGYGKSLVDLHLMRSADLNNPVAMFQGAGDYKVEKQRYSEKEKRVYINRTQYFEGVDNAVWEYHVGGYQVADKWLKDRNKKGRTLSIDDIKHYCRVITALSRTMEIQKEIDAIYIDIEKDVL
jgi:predicted helicase